MLPAADPLGIGPYQNHRGAEATHPCSHNASLLRQETREMRVLRNRRNITRYCQFASYAFGARVARRSLTLFDKVRMGIRKTTTHFARRFGVGGMFTAEIAARVNLRSRL